MLVWRAKIVIVVSIKQTNFKHAKHIRSAFMAIVVLV